MLNSHDARLHPHLNLLLAFDINANFWLNPADKSYWEAAFHAVRYRAYTQPHTQRVKSIYASP